MKKQSLVLGEAIANHNNNLNIVKLFAAIMVIVGHGYAFGVNYATKDWLSIFSRETTDLGAFAVNIFFFFSGLLIASSLMRNSDTKRYVVRRLKRIYPSFIIVTLLITFVAGPIISSLGILDYFANLDTYRYLLNLIWINVHDLPGVFIGNVYGRAVNGPIWTIRIEMVCYLLAFAYCRFGLMSKKKLPLSICCYMIMAGVIGAGAVMGNSSILTIIQPITMFYLGIIYAQYKDGIKLSGSLFMLATLGFVLLVYLKQPILAYLVFLPYMLCFIAFGCGNKEGQKRQVIISKICNVLNVAGRSSYEIYLWGGFVGQLVTYMYCGYVSPYINMAITIPVVIILGYITNRLSDRIVS